MTLSFIQKASFVSLMLLISIVLIFIFIERKEAVTPLNDKKGVSYPFIMNGVSLTNRENGRIFARIEADELKVNPRRFYVFNIKSVNEVTVRNAKIELFLYEDETAFSGTDIVSVAELILPYKKGKPVPKEIGRITRGVVNGLNIVIYKSGKVSILLRSNKGIIDFNKRTLVMKDVRLEEVSSRKLIESRTVMWDNKEKAFQIPGEYTAVTPKRQSKGYGLTIGLNS